MSRALEHAKVLNEDLERMRRVARVTTFELKKLVRTLQAAEGPSAEPHWVEALALEIVATHNTRKAPGLAPVACAAGGVVCT